MYTLRLILKGVIFLTMVSTSSGQDQLWLLLLDPGYNTPIHHQARIYVSDTTLKQASSRDFDGKDLHGAYFDLAGEHLTLSLAATSQPKSLFFAKSTRAVDKNTPCFDCGNAFTLRQQKDDFQWVNTLSEILKNVPLKTGHTFPEAIELRQDIVADSYALDGLILARIAIDRGEIRTYTLWKEEDNADNLVLGKISTYAFKKSGDQCDPSVDPHSAVAQTVAIELAVSGEVTFGSRRLAEASTSGRGNIVLKGRPGALAKVELVSMNHGGYGPESDFNAFYGMLKNPDYFEFLPLPAACVSGDSGGACSPATRGN